MTPNTHPTDEQLLLHAEGGREPAVERHLAGCEECREAVAASARGADALRTAPLLEYPAALREEVLVALPTPERARRSGRRFLGVTVPLVALASVVAVVGLTRGTTDPERTAEQMAAQDAGRAADDAAATDAPSAALEAAPLDEETARAPELRAVAGPPEEVAATLRDAGFDARVVDGAVEVRDADAAAVEEALRGRPDGDVEVRLR
jgi:predicted anti-sigma-YlaC factor YlaD